MDSLSEISSMSDFTGVDQDDDDLVLRVKGV